jgi:acyl-CoA hydrolase/RimJ/RimL family protein N-acetyltransferase
MTPPDGPWQSSYRRKVVTAQRAVRHIRTGDRVFIGSGCAEPQTLSAALAARGTELADTQIVHVLTLGTAPYADPKFDRGFRANAFYIGANVRDAVADGRADFTPIFMSELPALFQSGRVPIDVALISVSPPDAHGYCSLGVSIDVVMAAVYSAGKVVAEVNVNMPRTLGDSFVHVDNLDWLVPSDVPLLEMAVPEPDEVATRIGRNIAELIDDGATLQVGIGSIPDVVLSCLRDRKDLGIHTEMFSDGVVDLVERGVITGARKTIHRGKMVASFVLGTRRVFDFVDDNPMCEFHPTEYTNDPFRIAQNAKMVSINSALEVDLTGQVCADSIGTYFYSGIGGQVDFVRGAARSAGGKPIIALPSMAQRAGRSRIVSTLTPGAGVVTSRGDVHYVATEWGVADLHGKTIRERALALIHIAHPDAREELMTEARKRRLVPADQVAVLGVGAPELAEYESTHVTPGGARVRVRPIRPTDEAMMRELFYSFSEQTVYYRFFHNMKSMPHESLQRYVVVDYSREMALVAVHRVDETEHIVAVARYAIDPARRTAEVAFVTHDAWQRQGLGTHMFRELIRIARRHGASTFEARVLAGNDGMIRLFHKCALGPVSSKLEAGEYRLQFAVPQGPAPTAD